MTFPRFIIAADRNKHKSHRLALNKVFLFYLRHPSFADERKTDRRSPFPMANNEISPIVFIPIALCLLGILGLLDIYNRQRQAPIDESTTTIGTAFVGELAESRVLTIPSQRRCDSSSNKTRTI